MLVIRLRRTGRKKQVTYNIVLAEKARPVKGKFQENLGSYNPTVKPKELTYNIERINHWISKGAVPSDTVASILKYAGEKGLEKFIAPKTKKSKKKKEVPEEATPTSAPAAEAQTEKTEEPAPETTPEEKKGE